MKRIFLALKAKIDNYEKLQSDFEGVIKGNWVKDENLHVTVCYFGDRYEVDDILQKMPPLKDTLKEIRLSSLGYFEKNKILYAKAEDKELDMLQSSINEIFSLPNTKPFVIHVTLMRIKEVKDNISFKNILAKYKNKDIGTVSPDFELMQSHIEHPGGARYESLRKY